MDARICSGKDAEENETRMSVIAFCHAAAQKIRGATAAQACKGTGGVREYRSSMYIFISLYMFILF